MLNSRLLTYCLKFYIKQISENVFDILIILCKTLMVMLNLHTQNHGNAYPVTAARLIMIADLNKIFKT